ncbi:hypothetical protein PHLCEN_2v2781 [Hermanssonia centrifuga]|uniref:Uncharacterized protein n=1 Tax=Hermanssonia centrifuga TaxID=98765 RepID=A0A2R6RHZ2_9APHY|nr:hypothetical protein PHLCEN_2v2781 [Hermanssonia centrifuga]
MSARPSLPASSSDFALHPSSSALVSSHTTASEEFNPLLLRFRRPSLLAPPRAAEGRNQSPLASSFTIPRRQTINTPSGEESESDKDKMWTDSPPSLDSGATTPSTPSLPGPSAFAEKDRSTTSVDSDSSMKSTHHSGSGLESISSVKTTRPRSPTQPQRASPPDREVPPLQDGLTLSKRNRLSHPIKMPRILTLLAESHPEDNELKSEAQFQRFVASFSDHPTQPRTPRAASDRGRYPEDATEEEPLREDYSSDDEGEPDEVAPFSFSHSSEPINIAKPVTPAHSVYGDDMGLSESPGNMAMDIDMPSSACGSPKLTSWRYTPPPTSSSCVVRNNKRKLDDRYDPYPTSSKRRAVSPSLSYLRDTQPSLFTPRTPNGNRVPLPHPIAIPVAPSSGASSPIVSSHHGSRPMSWSAQSVMSSPTLRAQIGLASPVLRPMMRRREEGREVDGAGEAVNGLSLE